MRELNEEMVSIELCLVCEGGKRGSGCNKLGVLGRPC